MIELRSKSFNLLYFPYFMVALGSLDCNHYSGSYTSAYTWLFNRVRNRQELNASLKGATLGDADDDVDDTLNWIKRNKRKEKELALRRQQELESRDRNVLGEYTERKYLMCI